MKLIIGIIAICSFCACATPKPAQEPQKPAITQDAVRQNANQAEMELNRAANSQQK